MKPCKLLNENPNVEVLKAFEQLMHGESYKMCENDYPSSIRHNQSLVIHRIKFKLTQMTLIIYACFD